MRLDFVLRLPVTGPLASVESIHAAAETAEKSGWDALSTHDHIFHDYDTRYHHAGGASELVDVRDKMGLPVTNIYETLTVFSYVAGFTERVRLISCALVLPWRHPILLAKQVITLDYLSGGRFVCLVCLGNIKSDYEAMGVQYKRKGKIIDEYLTILKQLLSTGKVNAFQGNHIKVPECQMAPAPINPIPLWYGGSFTPVAYERVAKYATGFFPRGSPQEYEKGLPMLKDQLEKHGRKLSEVKIGTQLFLCLGKDGEQARKIAKYTVASFFSGSEWAKDRERRIEETYKANLFGTADDCIKKLQTYADAGVEIFDIRLIAPGLSDHLQMMKLFASDVISSYR
jgi:alkanesulfonate monooxygenase SsuD/methylene tetrahydromethanopterin reductase-like flavin-dependent oxidoreductase (luciferase family)